METILIRFFLPIKLHVSQSREPGSGVKEGNPYLDKLNLLSFEKRTTQVDYSRGSPSTKASNKLILGNDLSRKNLREVMSEGFFRASGISKVMLLELGKLWMLIERVNAVVGKNCFRWFW